jgi:hypothetical protein
VIDGVRLERLHLTMFVYGEKYSSIATSIVLPNLIGLIEEIPADVRRGTRLRILTDPPGAACFDAAPAMSSLRAMVPVDIDDTMQKAGFDIYGGYGPMILGQARLVNEASLVGAGIIFCPPDLVWSKGSFAAIVDQALRGYRAVIGPSARGIEEDLVPIFQKQIAESGNNRLDISSKDLTGLLYKCWQKMNDGFIWNLPASNVWKSYAYWRVGERQLLMKCWQGPALFLWPYREVKDYDGWIDHRLIRSCARNQSEVYVVPDAMMIQTLDLAPRDRGEGHSCVANKQWALFKQLLNRKRHCRLNILYGYDSIRIYDVPLPEEAWLAAERAFDRETLPAMYAAIALRPVLAVADGLYRYSGLASTISFLRAQARRLPVIRDLVHLARERRFTINGVIGTLRKHIGVRSILRHMAHLTGTGGLLRRARNLVVGALRASGLKPRTRLLALKTKLQSKFLRR